MAVDRTHLPQPGAPPPFRFPAIVRHRLPNGLELRTVEHPNAPVLAAVLLVRGGLGADPPSREGLAALTADLTDEGIGALSAIEVSDALARIGADYDLDVGADSISIAIVALSRFADRAVNLVAGIATRPSLREDDFTRVRRQRLARLTQLKTVPTALAESAFDRALYGSHPYGHLAIGSSSTLGALDLAAVQRFHASVFRPSRSTLVMVGSFTHSEMYALAEREFGGWTSSDGVDDVQVAADIAPPTTPTTRWAIIPREAAAQSELRIGQLTARRTTPDYSALLVMNAILGGQFISRVNLKLREEKGFTYGAFTGFDWRRGPAPFSLEASVHTASTAEAVTDSLRELEAIRGERPPTAEEMALAKASLTLGYPRGFETAEQVARSVASLALYELPDTYFEEFVPKVNAITADDVVRVANRYIDPQQLSTVIVGDHAAIGASLDALGVGEWQVLPAEL